MPCPASRPQTLVSLRKLRTDEFITTQRPSLLGEKSSVFVQNERAIRPNAVAAVTSRWTVEINAAARLDEMNRQIVETKCQFFLGETQVCKEDKKARQFSSRNFLQIISDPRRSAESCPRKSGANHTFRWKEETADVRE